MWPAIVVIRAVLFENSTQVTFPQDDKVVKAFTAERADQAFANRIGLWTVERGTQDLNPELLIQLFVEMPSELAVAVANKEAWSLSLPGSLKHLAISPLGGRVTGEVPMNNFPGL